MGPQPSATPLALLGDSFIFDEHKGDFAAARRSAESALDSARTAESQAQALLALAAVQTLQGDCSSAMQNCADARSLAPDDPAVQLRSTAIEMWTAITRWKLSPDGAALESVESYQQWPTAEGGPTQDWIEHNAIEFAGQMDERWTAWEPRVPEGADRLVSMILYHVLATLPGARTTVLQTSNLSTADEQFKKAAHPLMHFFLKAGFSDAEPRLHSACTMLSADLAFRAGRYDFARKLITSAATAYERVGDHAGAGACYVLGGDFQTGPAYSPLTWCLPLRETSSADSSDAGIEYHEQPVQGNLAFARDGYNRAARQFEAAGALRGMAALALRSCYLDAMEGRFEQARDSADTAIGHFERCGDRMAYMLAQTHRVLANIGISAALEDLETARAIGAWGREGSYSYALGLGILLGRAGRTTLVRRGDAERALGCFRMATALFQALGARLNIARSLADQGTAHGAIGNHHTAAADYEGALAAYLDAAKGRHPAVRRAMLGRLAGCLQLLYATHEHVVDFDGIEYAVARVEAALKDPEILGPLAASAARDGSMRDRAAKWLKLVPTGEMSPEALENHEQAGRMVDHVALQQLRWVIATGKVTAACYRARRQESIGESDKAAQTIQSAFRLAEEAGTPHRDYLLGMIHAHRRDFPQAIESFRRYWDHPERAGWTKFAAESMQESGTDPAAVARQRLHHLEHKALTLARLQDYAAAKEQYEILVREFGDTWWRIERHSTWEVVSVMAEVQERLGDPVGSLNLYTAAIGELEQKRALLTREAHRMAFGAQPAASGVYVDAARAAVQAATAAGSNTDQSRQATELGFICAQLNHARSLGDLLAAPPAGEASELSTEMRAANARISLCTGLLAHFRRKGGAAPSIDGLTKLLRAEDESLHRLERTAFSTQGSANPVQIPDVQAPAQFAELLPEGAAFIQFVVSGHDLLVWTVTKHRTDAHYTRLAEHELSRAVESARSAWGARKSTTIADDLSSRLLAPLRQTLDTNPTLIIVPSGPLHRLPFAGLPWSGTPLATTHTIATLPVASALFHLAARPASSGSGVFAAGVESAQEYFVPRGGDGVDLSEFSSSLAPLPFAALEARIAAAAGTALPVLAGREATRENVLAGMSRARVVHLAAHAVLVDSAPALSSIVLGHGESLSLLDLMQSRLDNILVTFSACRVAEGALTQGNDVVGMTRGLLVAGVRSAVLPLWSVQDTPTLLLMHRFYELLRGGNPIAPALRGAQHWLRELSGTDAADTARAIRTSFAGPQEVMELLNVESKLRKLGDNTPFADPLFWAPFTFTGLPWAPFALD